MAARRLTTVHHLGDWARPHLRGMVRRNKSDDRRAPLKSKPDAEPWGEKPERFLLPLP